MYSLIIAPFVALIGTQIIKVIIDSSNGKFSWKNFDSYGGMPSSHSALVAALATKAALVYGLNSGLFGISVVVAFVVIRDAVGFRHELSKHAKALNMLVSDLPDEKEIKYPHLEQRLGHTYTQAAVGTIIGIITAVLI